MYMHAYIHTCITYRHYTYRNVYITIEYFHMKLVKYLSSRVNFLTTIKVEILRLKFCCLLIKLRYILRALYLVVLPCFHISMQTHLNAYGLMVEFVQYIRMCWYHLVTLYTKS